MDELPLYTCRLHVCVQVDKKVIRGAVSTQTAIHYKPLCSPGEVLIRRDTFTPWSEPAIDPKYYYEPAGHVVWDPKETGTLDLYEEMRLDLKRNKLPVGIALDRCDKCLYKFFGDKYSLLQLGETEL